MDNTGHIAVLVTAGSEAEAQRISNAVLEARQAACVSIIPRVSTAYWWQGRIQSADEHLLVIKTKASRLDALVELVKRNHNYDVPEIIAVPVVGGNPEYLAWIDKEVCE